MRYIAYLRVSTDQQAENGFGLETQERACQGYAKKNGLSIEKVFKDEGLSGGLGIDKRPGLMNAISFLEKGDVLVVSKRDRLARGDILLLAMIEAAVERKKAKIASAGGEGTESNDPSSILMRRMIDAFAEYEKLIIGARTRAALQVKKSNGERTGRIPFGYRLSVDTIHIEKCPKEQEILRQIKDLRKKGLSVRKIANEMNARNAFNRGVSKWNHASMHRILTAAAA